MKSYEVQFYSWIGKPDMCILQAKNIRQLRHVLAKEMGLTEGECKFHYYREDDGSYSFSVDIYLEFINDYLPHLRFGRFKEI